MKLDSVEKNLSDDILSLNAADIQARTRLKDNEVSCQSWAVLIIKRHPD